MTPGPKHRPALVRAMKISPCGTMGAVEVTFGTSNAKHGERPFDLLIENSQALDECGLPCVTRFDLDNTIWLPWAREFFAPRKGQKSAVSGSLNEMGRMQLEDIKAARRVAAAVSRQAALRNQG